jgi:16S rRNA (guanine527-N7)-methyltransferase
MINPAARRRLLDSVSRETSDRLKTYHDLLLKWQRAINLVSSNTLADAWDRHFLDSAQLLDVAPTTSGLWLDIGSGAGFPGLVCAIVAAETRPSMAFHLVESDARKCSFLSEVARQCAVPVQITNARIESLHPQNAAIISARALAPLPQLLMFSAPHLAKTGHCLFLKGQTHDAELALAQADWHMTHEVVPSLTSDRSVVLKIGDLSHA